jgi:hypothetical protein
VINKSIGEITEQDLQTLIAQKEVEGKTIEYKQELPGNTDADKKEFLADVSSFANSSGGHLIYGMVEEGGIPVALNGLDIEDYDQVKQRLENLIRGGIEPRIPSLAIQRVPLSNTRAALIIRVPKSWSSPHRVLLGHDKFYARNSAGKYPLDVAELRVAFNLSETIAERIKNFRRDRISNLVANETPVLLPDTAKIALHLIPIAAFSSTQSYDINKITSNHGKMRPMFSSGWSNRYNLDGFLTYSGDEKQSHSYVQLFRNGIIEAAETSMLEPNKHGLHIPSGVYEQELIGSLREYLSLLETLTVEPPIFVFLTLLGVKGYWMATDRSIVRAHERHCIDRDIVLLPEIPIESYQVAVEDVLKPCFDNIWNACGFPKSMNYDQDGKWVGK